MSIGTHVFRSDKSKDRQQCNDQKKTDKRTMNYNTLHEKLMIKEHEFHKNWVELRCFGKVVSSCSTSDIQRDVQQYT
jgi:hypothetical protein